MEPPCYGRLNFLKKGAAIGSVVRASLVAYGFIEALASAVLVSGLCGSFGFAVVLRSAALAAVCCIWLNVSVCFVALLLKLRSSFRGWLLAACAVCSFGISFPERVWVISIARLRALPPVDLQPIYVIVFDGPYVEILS